MSTEPLDLSDPLPPNDSLDDPKERLLDAAEMLYAERGFEGTSLRAVTRAAGMSVSAANYHFGSKEELLRATLRRRVEPVNARRLARLDALEAEAGGEPLPLSSILEAFLRPHFEERMSRAEAPRQLRQVAARLYADPPELMASLKQELFGPISQRYLAALAQALPERSTEGIELAFQFVVAAMVHVIAGHLEAAPRLDALNESCLSRAFDDEALLQQMITFMTAGLSAKSGSGIGR